MDTEILDKLKSLHTAAIDARNGYEEALHDAEGRGLTVLFHRMIALHTQNGQELAAALSELGEHPDNKGSFMSTVHRTIISIRSLFGGLDESVLPGLIDGEERNIAKYGDLKLTELPQQISSVLKSQLSRLENAVNSMKSERDQAAVL